MWTSQEIRETFLQFFVGKGHKRLPSFPLVPVGEKTDIWISAGMHPFKAEFAGIAKPVSPRITTCQKCVRADDIERVGHTSRHHTFFEMLGNFSFGDYFKEEAILWAWELLTEKYKFPKEKLWISIHTDDDESHRIWNQEVGIPSEKIFRLSDNFWGPIGSTGTCGPDSEIYYDRGKEFSCGKPDCKPGCENKNENGVECDRYIELWNLVFTMYNKDETGKLHGLPKKNIDTGAGLERFTMALQKAGSPYETDLFEKIIARIKFRKSQMGTKIFAKDIVADHIRAVTFMIADGAVPSNEGRGYVLRRILRRAAVYLKDLSTETRLSDLVDPVIETMKPVYPELVERKKLIVDSVGLAEDEFHATLSSGMEALWASLHQMNANLSKSPAGKVIVPGSLLFRLHDERGLPFDLAKDILINEGYAVDEAGFRTEMEKQRERSRASRAGHADLMATTEMVKLPQTNFTGYETTKADAKILDLRINHQDIQEPAEALREGQEGTAVFDQTPFYAESGGQVGDTGTLEWEKGFARVMDTQKNEGGIFFHHIIVEKGQLRTGELAHAVVDASRREQIKKHHTATHLLHAALREVLGPHVRQAGSYVCDTYLRLDFSHPKSLSNEELAKIEALVNEKSCSNLQVDLIVTNQEEGKKLGALAFSGEKYGDEVRVVVVDEFSKELCGGTHVQRTGEIGPFVVIKESSIAKGIRRIEAMAGKSAIQYLGELQKLKSSLTERLKADFSDLTQQIDLVLSQKQESEKEVRRLKQELGALHSLSLLGEARSIDGISLIMTKVDADEKEVLRAMVDRLKERMKSGVVLLAASFQEKLSLVCGITPDLVTRGLSAVDLIKKISKIVEGGGGGRPDLAEAGGKNPQKLQEAFSEAEKIILSKTHETNR